MFPFSELIIRIVQEQSTGFTPRADSWLLFPIDGVAKYTQRWSPGGPIFCKVLSSGNADTTFDDANHIIVLVIVINVHNEAFSYPCPTTCFLSLVGSHISLCFQTSKGLAVVVDRGKRELSSNATIDLTEANAGPTNTPEIAPLLHLLENHRDNFSNYPRRVTTCIHGQSRSPLVDEGCHLVAAKQRRYIANTQTQGSR